VNVVAWRVWKSLKERGALNRKCPASKLVLIVHARNGRYNGAQLDRDNRGARKWHEVRS